MELYEDPQQNKEIGAIKDTECSSLSCQHREADLIHEIKSLRQELSQYLEEEKKTNSHVVVPNVYSLYGHSEQAQQEDDFSRIASAGTVEVVSQQKASCDPHTSPSCEIAVAHEIEQAFLSKKSSSCFSSSEFSTNVVSLCQHAASIFKAESRCLQLQSPLHIFGDIHGNLKDLHFFSKRIWPLGMKVTAGKFVFLGDYVDRGGYSLECVSYLLALKILYPTKMYMLRGNHELRNVNGMEEYYGKKCLLAECKDRFGTVIGHSVWEQINLVFDTLPIAAVVDNDIFCVHGGIPRTYGDYRLVTALERIPCASALSDGTEISQLGQDCLWADPAPASMEASLDQDGFGPSLRGGASMCFGTRAIESFLTRHNFSVIVRAHEACAEGVKFSKAGQVLTVFSTSKDHGLGEDAQCGCLLVEQGSIHVINRSVRYNDNVERSPPQGSTATVQSSLKRQSIGQGQQNNDDDTDDELDHIFDLCSTTQSNNNQELE